MAKNKYKTGHKYSCERCGNQVVVLGEGGGNLICCVKALTETGGPDDGAVFSDKSAPPAASEPARAPRPAPGGEVYEPKDAFQEQQFSGDGYVTRPLFENDLTLVELLCFQYGQQQEICACDDRDRTISLLEGRGLFQMEEREHKVTTGATLLVPRGVKCGVKNTNAGQMVVLVVSAKI